jgi:antagonist of KipI
MSIPVIEVLKPGLATTIQDRGRTGYQQYGIVVSGAMDEFSLQVANLLAGNERSTAGIEVALMGPELLILEDTAIAVCGADLTPKLDGEEIPMWKRVFVKRNQILSFGQPKNGTYAYLAIAGGIDVPPVMGSRSTYMKAELGGVEGRALTKGDVLYCREKQSIKREFRLSPELIPTYGSEKKARVIVGPDEKAFYQESLARFLSESYKVTSQSDRMGARLEGPELLTKHGADIISAAVLPGTIQVPSNGQPIVLLADRQTTGGYTRIATVISSDLPFVAQTLPGQTLRFQAVTVEEAQALHIEQEKLLRKLSVGTGVYK